MIKMIVVCSDAEEDGSGDDYNNFDDRIRWWFDLKYLNNCEFLSFSDVT